MAKQITEVSPAALADLTFVSYAGAGFIAVLSAPFQLLRSSFGLPKAQVQTVVRLLLVCSLLIPPTLLSKDACQFSCIQQMICTGKWKDTV